jgi:RNA polymerase sigma factor (sigma-70 family)
VNADDQTNRAATKRAEDRGAAHGADTESGLPLNTELALAEVIYSGHRAAPIVRFAVIALDSLSSLPIYERLARSQERAQTYLRGAMRRWALRSTATGTLDLSVVALAAELRLAGRDSLAQVAEGVAGADAETLLVRAIGLERQLGTCGSGPAARAFTALLDGELEGLEQRYPTTVLQRIDVAAAQRAARDFFVTAQLPIAERRARYVARSSRLPLADLVQIGAEALLHATDRFDPSFSVPFAAYAHRWITQRISRAEPTADLIPLPMRVFRARSDVRQAITKAVTEGVATSMPVLASHLGLPERVVRAVLQSDVPVVSLDGVTGRILEDTYVDDSAERVDARSEDRERAAAVRRALDTCPARERAILSQLFGIGCTPRPVDQVASEMGLTRQRVYQIRDIEIRRLRRPSVAKDLVAYA